MSIRKISHSAAFSQTISGINCYNETQIVMLCYDITEVTPMNDSGNYPDELGNFIRHIRKARGLTLRGLEEKSGISYSQLSKIERGESIPLKDNLDKIIEALGTDLKNRMYDLADYMPDLEYIKTLKQGYKRPQPNQSQDYIYGTAFNKLKAFRAKEGKETSYVSFDANEVIVYETEYGAGMVIEKIEKYNLSDVLNDKFEGSLDSLRKQPRQGRQAYLFGEWLQECIYELKDDDQDQVIQALKEFVQFKVLQVKGAFK
ncbi:anaerobic benzoate catabolism transcriptional regulator [compost metagenome]